MIIGRWTSHAIDVYWEWDDALKLSFIPRMYAPGRRPVVGVSSGSACWRRAAADARAAACAPRSGAPGARLRTCRAARTAREAAAAHALRAHGLQAAAGASGLELVALRELSPPRVRQCSCPRPAPFTAVRANVRTCNCTTHVQNRNPPDECGAPNNNVRDVHRLASRSPQDPGFEQLRRKRAAPAILMEDLDLVTGPPAG
jgi:hypothetical protein